MQIVTTFRQMPTSRSLREYGESKVAKLEKYFNGIIEAKITFSAGKTSQTAEVTLLAKGTTIRGEETASDAYAALDLVVDKLSRQLRKYQDKVKGHKGQAAKGIEHGVEELPTPRESKKKARTGKPRIATWKTFDMKPLSPEDAVLEMEQSADDFQVFINAESYDVNVIYRLKDGNYGLIEPDR